MNAKDAWLATLGQLQVQLNRATYDTWLRRAEFFAYEDGRFVVSLPNAYAQDWIERHLQPAIIQTLSKMFGREVELQLIVYDPASETAPNAPLWNFSAEAETGINQGEPINPNYTFENFVVGEANRYPLLLAEAITQSEIGRYSPVLFQGTMGVGKTHLLQAITGSLVARGLRVVYSTAEGFTTELVGAIKGGRGHELRQKYRESDAVLIDDLQFVEGKDSTQAELVAIWDALRNRRRTMIFASDRLPHEMSRLSKDARSRFQAGPIATIEPPDGRLRRDILEALCLRRNLNLPTSVLDTLTMCISGSVRDLEAAVDQLDAYSKLTQEVINPAALERVLRTLGAGAGAVSQNTPAGGIGLEAIWNAVSDHFGVSAVDLSSRKRTKHIALARQVAMYLAREDGGASLPQIGDALGGRDHSTIIHGCSRAAEMIRTDPAFAEDVAAVRAYYRVPVLVR